MVSRPRAPCITLTTDFATIDGYVGAMKGVLASRAPGVPIVDITHAIPRHDVAAAAFALAQAAPHFPEGTVHVAVVDPGVGTGRRAVVIRGAGQLFVGPDNGLFSLVAPAPDRRAYAIEEAAFRRERIASTFHGRDVFAPAAAALAMGAPAEAAGAEIELTGALAGAKSEVIHVDRFGNLITAIAGDRLPAGAVVRVCGRSIPLVSTYGDVEPGELLAYIGSADTLEIAVREGSAAETLAAGRGTPVSIE